MNRWLAIFNPRKIFFELLKSRSWKHLQLKKRKEISHDQISFLVNPQLAKIKSTRNFSNFWLAKLNSVKCANFWPREIYSCDLINVVIVFSIDRNLNRSSTSRLNHDVFRFYHNCLKIWHREFNTFIWREKNVMMTSECTTCFFH